MQDKKSLRVCSTCERLHDEDQFCPRRVAKALALRATAHLKTPADRLAFDIFNSSGASVIGVIEEFLVDGFIVRESV